MKNIIFVLLVASVFLNAGEVDNTLKKQCQYWIYGNGKSNTVYESFLYGVAAGTYYNTEKNDRSKKCESSYSTIAELGCKEALNDNSTESFSNKVNWGIAVTCNNKYAKYSKLK